MSRPVFFVLFTLTAAGAMIVLHAGGFTALFLLYYFETFFAMYLDEGIYILNCRGVYGDRRSKLLFVWLHAFLLTVLITLLFRYPHLPDLFTRLLFPVFYLINTYIVCISPLIRFLLLRRKLWKGLLKICKKYGFSIRKVAKGLFRTGKAKGSVPPVLELHTPAERFRICVLGRPGAPGLYTFHTEGDKILGYTVLFFKPEGDINDPYLKMSPEEVISSRPLKMKERFSLNRIGRRRLYPFPPAEEGVTNILLFCPDDFVCREISADRTIECGGEFCGYTVYNTALFLRGRLGEYLNHPGEVRHTGSEAPPTGTA